MMRTSQGIIPRKKVFLGEEMGQAVQDCHLCMWAPMASKQDFETTRVCCIIVSLVDREKLVEANHRDSQRRHVLWS